ncbi:MAG: hypothetical protein KIT84_43605 [Labilithrix sp.]|nr:hypothetical protein [Labilithrix sp.]MCW5817966.1 hypothetical protein [Labilithrix sp.]
MRLLRVTALLAALSAASPALADDATCIQSYEATQTLRKASKLKDSHAEAAKCADAACPAVLVKDCQKWLTEIDRELASLVFEVKDPNGEPLTNVKVTLDGQPLVDKIDASPVVVDPGTLTLHFESTDGKGKPVDQTVTVKDGEKAKKISVTLGGAPKPPAPVAPPERPIPVGAFAFGGAGVVALGVGAAFAVLGASAESDLESCKGRCPADDVNGVSTKYAVADILFAAGAVSLVAAAYIFLTRPASAPPTTGALRRGLTFEF